MDKIKVELEIKELVIEYDKQIEWENIHNKRAYKEAGGLKQTQLNEANKCREKAKKIDKQIKALQDSIGERNPKSYYLKLENIGT
jgi:hypothetical protein